MLQKSMVGLIVYQRYEHRLKNNGNRLKNNGVPSIKENNPIPKEKYCLEPLKDNKTKQNKKLCQLDFSQGMKLPRMNAIEPTKALVYR